MRLNPVVSLDDAAFTVYESIFSELYVTVNGIGDVTSRVNRNVNTPFDGTIEIGTASVTEMVRSSSDTAPSSFLSVRSAFAVWNTNVSPVEPFGRVYAILPDASAVYVAVVETPASDTVTGTVPPIRMCSPVNDTVVGVPAYAATGAGAQKYIANAMRNSKN